jgi:hypothetical protein
MMRHRLTANRAATDNAARLGQGGEVVTTRSEALAAMDDIKWLLDKDDLNKLATIRAYIDQFGDWRPMDPDPENDVRVALLIPFEGWRRRNIFERIGGTESYPIFWRPLR